METREHWHIVTPFKVTSFRRFIGAAKAAGFRDLFHRNQEGFAYCAEPRRDRAERPSLEELYRVLQAHLSPREYAMVRIHQFVEGGGKSSDSDFEFAGEHVRYEKVFGDRVEPSVYSDDYRR